MSSQNFKAGAARVKTTPALGTRINGDFVTHYATAVHDDLYSKALVLEQNSTRLALVMVDICVLPTDFVADLKVRIASECGIPASHVMIAATHTHAAGSVADLHLGSMDPVYAHTLPGLVIKSIKQAISKLEPARLSGGSVQAPEHLLCRRYQMTADYTPFNPVTLKNDKIKTNPFGAEHLIEHPVAPVDPELSFLAVQALDGRWIAAIGNYSLHYVGDWPDGTISADYFGVFSDQLGAFLQAGDDFVGMMSNGTSGDVNIWDFAGTRGYPKEYFEKSGLIGTQLAAKVAAALKSCAWDENPELSAVYKELALDIVKPTEEELRRSAEFVADTRYETIVPDQDGLVRLYAREQILLNETDPVRRVPIQAFRIGAFTIGALAGEFFSETGLYLKSEVKNGRYFTVTMANGNVGYVPPAAEIAAGGYETWRCRYSCLVPGSESTIRAELLALISRTQIADPVA